MPYLLYLLLLLYLLPLGQAQAAPCQINVTSKPKGATIYVDGEPKGKTPSLLKGIAPGKRIVSLERRGYTTVDRLLTCKSGGKHTLRHTLRQARSHLTIRSLPAGAQVRLNGRTKGRTPLVLSLAAGTYRLQLKKYRFDTVNKRIVLAPEKATHLRIKLRPKAGRLILQSVPSGADVFVGTQHIGKTPLRKELPSGMHTLILRKQGAPTTSRFIEIPPLGVTRLKIKLQRQRPSQKTPLSKRVYKKSRRAYARYALSLNLQIRQLRKALSPLQKRTATERDIKRLTKRLKTIPATKGNRQRRLRLQDELFRLYRKAAWETRQRGFRYNDKKGTSQWPKAQQRQKKAWRRARFYHTRSLQMQIGLVNRAAQGVSVALRCKYHYQLGRTLLQRKQHRAAIYPLLKLLDTPALRDCEEAHSATTRLGQALLALGDRSSLGLAHRYLLAATARSFRRAPTYTLALYHLGLYKKRSKDGKRFVDFAVVVRRAHRSSGRFESEEQRLWLLKAATREMLLAYVKQRNSRRNRTLLRITIGRKLYSRLLPRIKAMRKARKKLRRR